MSATHETKEEEEEGDKIGIRSGFKVTKSFRAQIFEEDALI